MHCLNGGYTSLPGLFGAIFCEGNTQKENIFLRIIPKLVGTPPHNGRTVAPEAILFESPCRAHSET